MPKVAIIGDRDSIMGFAALGVQTLETRSPEETRRLLRAASTDDLAVVFITEQAAEAVPDTLSALRLQRLPAILPIPSIAGRTGLGMTDVRETVRKAVGVDLFALDEPSGRDKE